MNIISYEFFAVLLPIVFNYMGESVAATIMIQVDDGSGNVVVCNADNGSVCNQQNASNASEAKVESKNNQYITNKGYCTFLPTAGVGKKIVNDRCTIVKIDYNSYQLVWSDNRQMRITLNPASIDGNDGKLIEISATSASIKTRNGKVGFCWNC